MNKLLMTATIAMGFLFIGIANLHAQTPRPNLFRQNLARPVRLPQPVFRTANFYGVNSPYSRFYTPNGFYPPITYPSVNSGNYPTYNPYTYPAANPYVYPGTYPTNNPYTNPYAYPGTYPSYYPATNPYAYPGGFYPGYFGGFPGFF
jgi:hypothetical protein